MKVTEAIRLHHKNKDRSRGLFILEYPPTCRHVMIAGHCKWRLLSFPYHYMLLSYRLENGKIRLEGFRLAWRRKPLEKINDKIGADGLTGSVLNEFCKGDFRNIGHEDAEKWLNYVVRWFWSSRFNAIYGPAGLGVDNWELWTRENPAFIMDVGWPEETSLVTALNCMGWSFTARKKLLPRKESVDDKVHCDQ